MTVTLQTAPHMQLSVSSFLRLWSVSTGEMGGGGPDVHSARRRVGGGGQRAALRRGRTGRQQRLLSARDNGFCGDLRPSPGDVDWGRQHDHQPLWWWTGRSVTAGGLQTVNIWIISILWKRCTLKFQQQKKKKKVLRQAGRHPIVHVVCTYLLFNCTASSGKCQTAFLLHVFICCK